MIYTDRLSILPAGEEHIEAIMEIERHKDNRDFIWSGTYDQHKEEIDDPNHLLLVFQENATGMIVGFALIHLNFRSNIFELRRIAITVKGIGYGKEALTAIIRYAFEETDTNRFWLDVYPDNSKGIQLYESLGFHKDGVLRQNYRSSRGYLDQIVYSMLREEYINSFATKK
jgi:RimJ/RimL family protein N-acetyltransferase